MITLKILAERARKKIFKVTNDEAIDIFLLIPLSCERYTKYIGKSKWEIMDEDEYIEILNVKGLGEFEIIN